MKIFLAGGGNEKDSVYLDKKFVSMLDVNQTLAYVPVAMQNNRYDQCLNWFNSIFFSLGIQKIEMWSDLKKINEERLDDISGIYIGGGNPIKLIKEIQDSSFYKFIKKFLNRNRPVYGGSAGAAILGHQIYLRPLLEIYENHGLDILLGYSIYVHYKQEDVNKIQNRNGKVIAIPERSGAFIDGKYLEVFGFEPLFLINEGFTKRVEPGQRLVI